MITTGSWMEHLRGVLSEVGGDGTGVDRRRVRPGVNTYIVPSFDRTALQFSLPVRVERDLVTTGKGTAGLDGVAAVAIEAIKEAARDPSATDLDPLAGRGTGFPDRYTAPVEPYTLIASPSAIGMGLFSAGDNNRAVPDGFELTVTGALPPADADDPGAVRDVAGRLDRFVRAIGEVVQGLSDPVLCAGRTASLDQKGLRRALPSLGLVSFVGDGTLPAREYTRHRCHYRVAGPRRDSHIAFRCPAGLAPIEIELPASGEGITGLGLSRGEVFAIAGSNAEGKSTLLSAILSGVDDHLPGDGRERVVTVPGGVFAEAGTGIHHAADLSLFFDHLPTSLRGTPGSASGPGSGSTSMAEEMVRAVRRQVPILAFDEDRSAVNLLVPSCLSAPGVVPLSTLLATRRECLGTTTILFTAGALDLLTAEADRILVLEGFHAKAMDRSKFRERLVASLRPVLERLSGS